jgi:hypothetical protein
MGAVAAIAFFWSSVPNPAIIGWPIRGSTGVFRAALMYEWHLQTHPGAITVI